MQVNFNGGNILTLKSDIVLFGVAKDDLYAARELKPKGKIYAFQEVRSQKDLSEIIKKHHRF